MATKFSNVLSLTGIWRLRAADEADAISVAIPGDNYSALQDAGRIPDPYWRDNEIRVQWVAYFVINNDFLRERHILIKLQN